MANSVDPDETPRSAASHLGLHCLLRPVCPNTYGKYGKGFFLISYDAQHMKRALMQFVDSIGLVQCAHLCSLIWVFSVQTYTTLIL